MRKLFSFNPIAFYFVLTVGLATIVGSDSSIGFARQLADLRDP